MDEKTKPISYSVAETPRVTDALIDLSNKNLMDESVMLEVKVTKILHELGLAVHLLGFQYARTAIIIASRDFSFINKMSKKMYPKLAEIFETSPSRVERAIRHCIELAYKRGNTDLFDALFESIIDRGKEKPSNSEFIALIADRLHLLMKAENCVKRK